ncbi:MAG: AraC family transcriptional regulator [Clostridia bacterium]|nr:AraC family transcriptional regulator [Clostridia bacterium]
MLVSELISLIEAKNLTPSVSTEREVTCGYVCDLLSWVMSHGDTGMAWVTVQTHMNVVAVAVLSEMACIILPEEIDMEEESLNKAIDEDMVVLTSPLTAYEICGRMAANGIAAHN